MTSQIRVDEITNRSGLGTVTIYDNGFEFTGVTTFTEDVDITGGLTIGGVLTYEDTTNIDSVGLITARAGIRVTGDSIHVESSEDRLLYLKSTDANAYLTFEDTDSSSAFANRVGTVSDGLYFSTGGGGERLRITSDGKMGLGISSPARGGLHIHKASTAELHLTDDTTGSGSGDGLTIFSTISSAGVWYRENANLRFATNNTERVIITSGGNVDINGTPPWTVTGGNYRNLSISGSDASSSGFLWLGNGAAATNADFDLGRVNFVNGTNIVAQIKGTTQTSANDDGRISFMTKVSGSNITERLRITSDGNIGMGGITSPSFTTGGGIHLKRNYGIGFGDGSNGRPDFQLVTTGGSTLDFRCGFGADTADISMTTGGNLVFASGGGIDFSATSDGSGTVASELFDDYEEGSFTPTIEWGGTSATLTGGTYGRYTKIGNTVIINFRIIQSSRNATSGSIRMYGLPYNEGSSAAYNHGMVQMDSGGNMPSGAGSIMMYFSNNNVRFLYQTNTAHSDLDASHCVDGTAWYGFATYFTS